MVASFSTNSVWRLDTRTDAVTELRMPGDAVAVGADAVWVALQTGAVARVDPSSNAVIETIEAGLGPTEIAVGEGGVWVANGISSSVTRIDPETGRVVATIPLGNQPEAIVAGQGAVWVTVY